MVPLLVEEPGWEPSRPAAEWVFCAAPLLDGEVRLPPRPLLHAPPVHTFSEQPGLRAASQGPVCLLSCWGPVRGCGPSGAREGFILSLFLTLGEPEGLLA